MLLVENCDLSQLKGMWLFSFMESTTKSNSNTSEFHFIHIYCSLHNDLVKHFIVFELAVNTYEYSHIYTQFFVVVGMYKYSARPLCVVVRCISDLYRSDELSLFQFFFTVCSYFVLLHHNLRLEVNLANLQSTVKLFLSVIVKIRG